MQYLACSRLSVTYSEQLTMNKQDCKNECRQSLADSSSSSSGITSDLPLSQEETTHLHSSGILSMWSSLKRFTSLADQVSQQEVASMMGTASTLVSSTKTDMMVQESNFSHQNSRSVMCTNNLSKMYKSHNIRWTTCKICRAEDLTQESFVSELVLGVDYCLCSLIGKHQEHLTNSYFSGKIDGDQVQISNSDSGSRDAHAKSYPDTVWREDNNTVVAHSGN